MSYWLSVLLALSFYNLVSDWWDIFHVVNEAARENLPRSLYELKNVMLCQVLNNPHWRNKNSTNTQNYSEHYFAEYSSTNVWNVCNKIGTKFAGTRNISLPSSCLFQLCRFPPPCPKKLTTLSNVLAELNSFPANSSKLRLPNNN